MILDAVAGDDDVDGVVAGANTVLARLRTVMIPIIGERGYTALMIRGLAVAQPGVVCLVVLSPDQSDKVGLALPGSHGRPPDATRVRDATVALIAAIISLLFTFIGEHLTRRAIQRGWPDLEVFAEATAHDPEETSDE